MNERETHFAILKAQSGDIMSLDALFRSVQKPLYRCVRGIVGDRAAAEDVTQDVFIILQKSLVHLRDPALFRSWSFRIASREAIRFVKKQHHRTNALVDIDTNMVVDDASIDPLASMAYAELVGIIEKTTPASRVVLVLHYLNELTIPEIAEILGIPLGTAKSRLSYGLQFVRRRFEASEATRSHLSEL